MGKYHFTTIKKAVTEVAENHYLLPAIQRKFVWNSEQIERLFDSILRNYPINSFMFWKITDENIKNNYKFYSFIKDYVQWYNENNPEAPSTVLDNFYAVIDGQQRLTSLYIGLSGTYRAKLPNKRWKYDEKSMPTRKLYLELTAPLSDSIDNEKFYNFQLLTEKEFDEDKKRNPNHFWFKAGDILKFKDISDVLVYASSKQELKDNSFGIKTLGSFFNKIQNEDVISFYLVEEQETDKVLDIFLRTNSGGTPLSFSDLLMSIASANWEKYDARDQMAKIRKKIYEFGNPSFDVSQDFILKSILVLSDVDIKFKIKNFGKENISLFEEKWDDIKESLVATFQLLEEIGFNDILLRAKNAAIPIAYYIYKNNLSESIVKTTYNKEDKKNIAKWLSMSLLKGTFGGQSDGVLNSIRTVIRNSVTKEFPIQEIFDEFRNTPDKNYSFDDAVIDSFLEEEKGSSIARIVLGLLYPDVVLSNGKNIAEDHMHPKTLFEDSGKLSKLGLSSEEENFFRNPKNYNSVLNLQLLEEIKNKEKGDEPLKDWAQKNGKTFSDLYVKKDTDLDIKKFKEFIEARRKILREKMKKILSV